MIQGANASEKIAALFVTYSNDHIAKLENLADVVKDVEPTVAGLLRSLSQHHARMALELIAFWPASQSCTTREGDAGGIQRSA